jgi:hypothetical protein
LFLLNTSAGVQTGSLEFLRDDGSPFAVTPVGGSAAASFGYSIQPGGVFVFETAGLPQTVDVGWARLIPSPGSTSPAGAGAFRFSLSGTVVSDAGIPSAEPTTLARIYVDRSNGHDTGIAIANPNGSAAGIQVTAFEANGRTTAGTGPSSFDLSAAGHRARFAGQLIAGLPPDFTGVLQIASSVPFVALTVRLLTNTRGDALLTTLPIADLTRPAPEPVIFPQIADGGGYQTELILLSPHGDLQAAVRYFADDGSPLPVRTIP